MANKRNVLTTYRFNFMTNDKRIPMERDITIQASGMAVAGEVFKKQFHKICDESTIALFEFNALTGEKLLSAGPNSKYNTSVNNNPVIVVDIEEEKEVKEDEKNIEE